MTDRRRLSGPSASASAARRCLLAQIRYAVDAGIDVVQVRERDLEARSLYELVREVLTVTAGSPTRVVVNDRLDVALAAGADGVHLRGDSVATAAVRTMVPPGFLIGRSVHDVAEAAGAAEGADYLIAGTVWPTSSKPADRPLLGLAGLARLVQAVSLPVIAIGGITIDRLREVAQSHAAGIAGIGLYMTDPADTTEGCRATALAAIATRARAIAADSTLA